MNSMNDSLKINGLKSSSSSSSEDESSDEENNQVNSKTKHI